ncbi:MAG: metallophosphoesterase [Alphaproteobacteria bacterium]|nr:metallophosphoesterase [Alphaproteobacteria bacterium]
MDGTPTPRTRPRVVARLPASQRLWIVSDLHLGDGTPSDVFFGKDRHLLALIDACERDDAVLVVNGDAIDFHQAWSFVRVLRAHKALLGAMSRLARDGRMFYVVGNHDYDITLFSDVLSFQVCDELHVGDTLLIRHGYEYDPYITEMLEHGQWHTKLHHAIERWLNTWLRIPLGEFYTLPNRLLFWLGHKAALSAWVAQQVGERLGVQTPVADEIIANLDFFAWSNMGDSMGIFRPAMEHVLRGPWRFVVCGHSHLPGVVRRDDRAYANTGSWTFASSQYVLWDGHDVSSHDWITGRAYGEELYRPMLDGSLYERDVFQWWRENYLGWLRFREGEERIGRLRTWQTWVQDHQRLAQLRPLPEPPPAPRATPPHAGTSGEAAAAPRLEVVHDATRPPRSRAGGT